MENDDPKQDRRGAKPGDQGQQAFVPTEEQRANVYQYARIGLGNHQIGLLLEIGATTVNKYFHTELQKGRANGVAVAGGKLFEKVLDGNLAAVIFYLKSKGGFNERAAMMQPQYPGSEDDADMDFNEPMDGLNDTELAQFTGLLRKLIGARSTEEAGAHAEEGERGTATAGAPTRH